MRSRRPLEFHTPERFLRIRERRAPDHSTSCQLSRDPCAKIHPEGRALSQADKTRQLARGSWKDDPHPSELKDLQSMHYSSSLFLSVSPSLFLSTTLPQSVPVFFSHISSLSLLSSLFKQTLHCLSTLSLFAEFFLQREKVPGNSIKRLEFSILTQQPPDNIFWC